MNKDAQKPGPKNRYRKIEVRMWGDEKFRALSPMAPSGQSLWVFLLTGPHTGPIPGLFRSGRAALAEELDWEIEDFDKAFREVFQQGMAEADWKAKVVWIPKAIQCNRPESPNVVLSWGGEWDLIPECDLKREAYDALKASIYALGEGFARAFDKAFYKPSGKPSGKTCRNQEQEQEQKQETDMSGSAPGAAAPPVLVLEPGNAESPAKPRSVDIVFDHWQSVMGSPRSKLDAKREKVIKSALKAGYSTDDLCKAIDGCALSPFHMGLNDQRTKYNGIDLILRNADQIDKFVALADAPPPASPAPGGGKMPGAADWADSTESVMAMAKRHGLEQQNGEHYIWFRLRVIKAHGDEALMERELSAASRRNEGEYERLFKLFFGVAPKMLPNGGYEKRPQRASF